MDIKFVFTRDVKNAVIFTWDEGMVSSLGAGELTFFSLERENRGEVGCTSLQSSSIYMKALF